jgi:uncharacterized protein (TIGR03083 family)
MEYAEHIAAVEGECHAMAAALRADPAAPVPTCPEWTLADLADHVGGFTAFWTHVLCDGTGRPKTPFPDRPAGPEAGDWFAGLGRALVDELRAAAADTKVWTWAPDQSAGFVARRAAHELSVHRVDAQLASGPADAIDAAVAADGIDEILTMISIVEHMPSPTRRVGRGGGETLHLHGTDRDDEWLLTMASDGLRVERRHAKGDLALRGAVSDLELLLYRRPPRGQVERFGDGAVLDTWYRVWTFG